VGFGVCGQVSVVFGFDFVLMVLVFIGLGVLWIDWCIAGFGCLDCIIWVW